jgi:hypothetical protein
VPTVFAVFLGTVAIDMNVQEWVSAPSPIVVPAWDLVTVLGLLSP